jgi:replication factor C subunit 3/5
MVEQNESIGGSESVANASQGTDPGDLLKGYAGITSKATIPWVEKYRPSRFNDIVLDPLNRQLFTQMLDKNYFPHLLFYGPPGTGKTTSIINLINEYQIRNNVRSNSTIMHLNASDERGIDIIRNQIYLFAKTMNLFESGLKFVILDEVDYMTKNAQQALKYILQTSNYHVRFCLVCNYITKIDESLKNEFICVRFNQLPQQDVHDFLRKICRSEGNIHVDDETLRAIQDTYHSDIRSMINYLQLHQTGVEESSDSDTLVQQHHPLRSREATSQVGIDLVASDQRSTCLRQSDFGSKCIPGRAILGDSVLEDIRGFMIDAPHDFPAVRTYFREISIRYNIDPSSVQTKFLNYMIRHHTKWMIDHHMMDQTRIGVLMHGQNIPPRHALEYMYYMFRCVE